jgi:tripartite-type tricarboxylate transporter receptor subunit TctC
VGRIYFLALTFALLVLEPMTVWAQSYPTRTVAVIVPFPPGGSVDGVARIIVDRLNQSVGAHFIVENRAGGASGNVGASVVPTQTATRSCSLPRSKSSTRFCTKMSLST